MNNPCKCPLNFDPATTFLSNTKYLPPVFCQYPSRRPKNCRSNPVLLKEIADEHNGTVVLSSDKSCYGVNRNVILYR